MRKLKRIIALLTVAMFLLSLAAPAAMAATKEDAFGRLKALNVAVGDATGDPQYDKNFTRAEAAAIMVNLSGMNSAINSAKGPTKFKDVPASHWASGVINLAVGSGIIKGYPDGTYKPDANVTYAEMSAMLVGVLGYTPRLQGTWPSNVIGKAAQLGLLDGVSVSDYNAAAVRSNVFLASDNALDTKPLKETNNGFEEDTKTLMETKLQVTKELEGYIVDVPILGNVNKDEMTLVYLDGNVVKSKSLKLIDGIDANKYLGLKGVAWVKDDKCFFFDVKTAASDIIDDQIKSVTATTIKLKNKDKTYDYTTNDLGVVNADIWYNYAAKTAAAFAPAEDDNVRVILENGKASFVICTSYATGLVDAVNTADQKITLKKATGVSTIELEDKSVTITKNGAVAKLDAIKAGDVVDYLTNDDMAYVKASDASKTGKLKSSNAAADSLTFEELGGGIDTITGGAWVSKDNGSSWESDRFNASADYDGYFGETAKILLTSDGKIAFVLFGAAGTSNYAPVLVKKIKYLETDEAKKVSVTKADGTQTTYVVTKDTKIDGTKITDEKTQDYKLTTGSKTVINGQIVKISLSSDGTKIDNIKLLTSNDVKNEFGGAPGAQFYVNKNTDTIKVAGGSNYKVDDTTKIIKVKKYITLDGTTETDNDATPPVQTLLDRGFVVTTDNYIDDTESSTWASLEGLDDNGDPINGNVAVFQESGVAKLVVVYNTDISLSSDYKYAVVTGSGYDVDGAYLKVFGKDMNGVTYTNDANLPSKKGMVLRFKLDTDSDIESGANMAEATPIGSYIYYYVYAVDTSKNRIKVVGATRTGSGVGSYTWAADDVEDNGQWIDVNDKTIFADNSDYIADKATTTVKTDLTLGSLAKGDFIAVYDLFDTNGNADDATAFNTGENIYDFVVRVAK